VYRTVDSNDWSINATEVAVEKNGEVQIEVDILDDVGRLFEDQESDRLMLA
jgi:hypothetical protein